MRVHPILVFLAVIIGGGLGGIVGVLLAVPTLAVLRVSFDFLRPRLRTDEPSETPKDGELVRRSALEGGAQDVRS
jgi:predicted PurR-regulated permease PerM